MLLTVFSIIRPLGKVLAILPLVVIHIIRYLIVICRVLVLCTSLLWNRTPYSLSVVILGLCVSVGFSELSRIIAIWPYYVAVYVYSV